MVRACVCTCVCMRVCTHVHAVCLFLVGYWCKKKMEIVIQEIYFKKWQHLDGHLWGTFTITVLILGRPSSWTIGRDIQSLPFPGLPNPANRLNCWDKIWGKQHLHWNTGTLSHLLKTYSRTCVAALKWGLIHFSRRLKTIQSVHSR